MPGSTVDLILAIIILVTLPPITFALLILLAEIIKKGN